MQCKHCDRELTEDGPHVKNQHHEFGEYRLTHYFCNPECQTYNVLINRWGMSEKRAFEVFHSRHMNAGTA